MEQMLLEGFIEFARQEYCYDILLDKNAEKDTFEKIFHADFNNWEDL